MVNVLAFIKRMTDILIGSKVKSRLNRFHIIFSVYHIYVIMFLIGLKMLSKGLNDRFLMIIYTY